MKLLKTLKISWRVLDEMDIEKYVSNTLPAINSLIVNLNRIAESINATTVQDIGTNLNTLLTNTDTKISEIDIQSLNELIGQLDVAAKNFGDMAQKTNTTQTRRQSYAAFSTT